MPSAHDLKIELRNLRKESLKPVSKMRVADISAEIQRLKGMREETPAVAAIRTAPLTKAKAAVKTIQEAKANNFPAMPDSGVTAGPPKKAAPERKQPKTELKDFFSDPAKKSKLEKLMAMMDDE